MGYTVGDVAKLARISVRALHHYDAIKLLEPSGRTEAGYRLYTDRDLEKLQQILLLRELGFALDAIARIVRDPAFDRKEALLAQRALLIEKGERLRKMVALVDKTLHALEEGAIMNREEMFEVFGEFDPEAHEEETKARWGDTDSYAESKRRTKRYTKDDWKAIRDEGAAINAAFAKVLAEGIAPTDPRAMDIAERARLHIDKWFYPCSHAMHASLGEMYVGDPRFSDTYERIAPGLAQFACDAIGANAERARGA